jgi:hypothetical protein
VEEVVGAARREVETVADGSQRHSFGVPHQEFEDIEDARNAVRTFDTAIAAFTYRTFLDHRDPP